MILYDTPRMVEFRGRRRRTAHLMIDLLGEAGTRELIRFARSIGLQESWIQHRGEYREHFDLFDSTIDRAAEAGAECVRPRDLVLRCVRPKRGGA